LDSGTTLETWKKRNLEKKETWKKGNLEKKETWKNRKFGN
jgi:hypothetical protein